MTLRNYLRRISFRNHLLACRQLRYLESQKFIRTIVYFDPHANLYISTFVECGYEVSVVWRFTTRCNYVRVISRWYELHHAIQSAVRIAKRMKRERVNTVNVRIAE